MTISLNTAPLALLTFNDLPEGYLGSVCEFTEDPYVDSLVSKKFNKDSQDAVTQKYFFSQFQSIVGVDLPTFELFIKVEPKDTWFIKNKKAFAYLNDLRQRAGLESIVLHKKGGKEGSPEDVLSTSGIIAYKKAYQEVVDANFILFWEKIKDDEVNDFLSQTTDLPTKDRANSLREFIEVNQEVYQKTSINLQFSNLILLPPEIGKFINLTELNLYNNQLAMLPESLGNLINLTELDLSKNQLAMLPESFGKLINLTELNLSFNQLAMLPESFGKLILLTELNRRSGSFYF